MIDLKKYPFVKCLRPTFVYNKYIDEKILVCCGKCAACRASKASQHSLQCKLENKCHAYTYFVTLTYNQDFIPRLIPVAVQGTKGTVFDFVSVCDRLDEQGLVYATLDYTYPQVQQLAEKCKLDGQFGYLSLREIQLFMKRLRKHLKKYTDERVRYYAVGEYGPKSLRPHYHLLLWFDRRETSEVLESCINQSWKFGITDIQAVQRDASQYVAGYVNSFGNLPRLYSEGQCKPFSCHSVFLGKDFFSAEKETVYKMSPREFIKRSVKINGSNTDFTLWRSITDSFYPRIDGFNTSTASELELSYQSYAIFRRRSESNRKPYQLAKEIVSSLWCDKPHYDRTDMAKAMRYFDGLFHIHDLFEYANHPLTPHSKVTEAIQQVTCIKDRIYRILRVSKHFLEFVCNSYHPIEVSTKLEMIRHFWKHVDYMHLTDSLKMQCVLAKDRDFDHDDIELFYDSPDLRKYDTNKLCLAWKSYCLRNVDDRMKHKRQNDANRIWFRERNL